MFDDINEAIEKAGGTYVKLNRQEHGTLEGVIIDAEVRGKTFEGSPVLSGKTGKQRQEWLFTLQTEYRDDENDDGVRKFAANESAQYAIREAVKAAGGRLETGGTLKIAIKTDPKTTREQAEYQAKYTAPITNSIDNPPF